MGRHHSATMRAREFPRPVDLGFYAKALLASAVPALAVYVPSAMISDRALTLVPYSVIGVGLCLLCAKLLEF